jgi:hypothetical protein
VVAALAVSLPGLLASHAPGGDAAFHTTAARLALWRDGIPRTLEPLLPFGPFGAHGPALATVAADLAWLAGVDPAAGVAALLGTAIASTLLGLAALHATWQPPRAAAVGALVGMALAPWPHWLAPLGPAATLVGLAFVLPSAALVVGHRSRSSAVAAGFLLAAGALAHPLLAGLALAGAALALIAKDRRAPRSPTRRDALKRLTAVVLSALLCGLAGLLPLARALSWTEVARASSELSGADLAWFAAGAVALLLGPAAVSALVGRRRRATVVLALAAAALLAWRVHVWIAAGQLSPADLAALRRASASTRPLQALCAPESLRDWVPAIAGRPAGEPGPWIPAVHRDEWAARRRDPCVALGR